MTDEKPPESEKQPEGAPMIRLEVHLPTGRQAAIMLPIPLTDAEGLGLVEASLQAVGISREAASKGVRLVVPNPGEMAKLQAMAKAGPPQPRGSH